MPAPTNPNPFTSDTDTDAEQNSGAPDNVENEASVDPPAEPVDSHAEATEAFKQGVESVTPADAPRTVNDARSAADVAAEAAATAAASQPTDPAASTPAAPDANAEAAAQAARLAEDAEIKALGFRTPKGAERYREMSRQERADAPVRELLASRKITDPAVVARALDNSDRFVAWEDALVASTATPEQFSSALNVIQAMNGNDPVVLNKVYDALQQQIDMLGQKIGRGTAADPLADYPDLREMVDDMDITLAGAQEMAMHRAGQAMRTNAASAQQEQVTQQSAEQAEIARVDGIINTMSEQFKAADPVYFTAKLQTLATNGTMAMIKEHVPRAHWPDAVRNAYLALPNPQLVAPPRQAPPQQQGRVRTSNMPMRSTGNAGHMQTTPSNDREAFLQGVEQAST